MSIICISIDLDPLSCYYDIHGIDGYKEDDKDIIYTRGLERIYNFFRSLSIKPTLFVVGRLLNDDDIVANLKSAVSMGYEIANHSLNHLYNLSLLSREEIEKEIIGCDEIIFSKLGVKSSGFRAPGYNLNPYFIRVITDSPLEYRYDSSVLPSPFYYFTKCAIIFLYRLLRRKTKSICGDIRMPFANRDIYAIGEDLYCESKSGKVLEIPISVAGLLGIPYVGTFIMGYKDILHRYLKNMTEHLRFLHIELHGIDFLDKDDIKDQRLLKSQFDLNIPLEKKLNRLKSIIDKFNPDRSMRLMDFGLKNFI